MDLYFTFLVILPDAGAISRHPRSSCFINHDLWLAVTYFTVWSYLVTYAFQWKKLNMDFPDSFVSCDLKDSIYIQLTELMKICSGQGHYLTLAKGHLHVTINT